MKHFSKYGLEDSDNEVDEAALAEKPQQALPPPDRVVKPVEMPGEKHQQQVSESRFVPRKCLRRACEWADRAAAQGGRIWGATNFGEGLDFLGTSSLTRFRKNQMDGLVLQHR